MVKTAESLKRDQNNAVFSKWSELLSETFTKKNIPLLNHSNINQKRHLNKSRLHLNNCRKRILLKNIRNFFNGFDWCIVRDNKSASDSPPFSYHLDVPFDHLCGNICKKSCKFKKPKFPQYRPFEYQFFKKQI